jgi:protein required for attachment to host cells
MKNWLVVANASRARVLEETGEQGVYAHRADLVHPGSRLKGTELGDDRPGHVTGPGRGPGGAAFDAKTDVRERERERFAHELAALLDAGVAGGECSGIVLVASNPFLGHLQASLGEHARKAVLRVVPADYTTLRDDELAQRIGAVRIGS